ncbi:MAG: hypothetical protein ACPL7L_02155 [bacterium]
MKIKIVDLDGDTLSQTPQFNRFPFSCKYCLYWENPQKMQDGSPNWKERAFLEKLHWVEITRREFGPCGKLLFLEGEGAGYAQYGPPRSFPNAIRYPSGPLSDDAIFLACLFIPNKRFFGWGLGKKLLQGILEELRERGFKAVETFARKSSLDNPSGPLELYLDSGFHILRDDPDYPLVRLSL